MIILIGIFGLVFGFIFAYSCESLGWDSFNIVYAIPVLILLNFLSFRILRKTAKILKKHLTSKSNSGIIQA